MRAWRRVKEEDKEGGQENGTLSVAAEQASRAALHLQLRKEANGDLYLAFLSCLRQLIEGKMEASTYEDVLRTLLGSNAYILFTLHKIISQARYSRDAAEMQPRCSRDTSSSRCTR